MHTSQQLGGHTSRGHPGMSKTYQSKIQTRKNRESERQFLLEAKQIFAHENPGVELKNHRAEITQIKKDLMKIQVQSENV